jgi:hypothetical protein
MTLMAASSATVQTASLLEILRHHAAKRKLRHSPDELIVSTSWSQELQSLLIPLSRPGLSTDFLAQSTSRMLERQESFREGFPCSGVQLEEEEDLEWTVTTRLLVGTYGRALEDLSKQAREAEEESQWWGKIEKSRSTAMWYLLQSTRHT